MKNIKLIAMTLILVIVIGFGVYLTTGNEKEVAEGEANGKEVTQVVDDEGKQVTDVNTVTPFYYEETFEAVLPSALRHSRFFFRYDGHHIKSVETEYDVQLVYDDTDEILTRVAFDVFYSVGFTLSSDGYIWQVTYDPSERSMTVFKKDLESQTLSEVRITDLGLFNAEEFLMLSDFKVEANHIFMLGATRSVEALQVYDMTGQLVVKHENIKSFDVDEEGKYIFSTTSSQELPYNGCFKFDITNGEELFRNTKYVPELVRYSKDYSKILLVRSDIVLIDAERGSNPITIFEFGRNSSFLVDGYKITDAILTADQKLKFSRSELKIEENRAHYENRLFVYDKAEGMKTVKEPTLVFSAPYRSDFMMEAIKRYELKYPEEHIQYDFEYNTYEDFANNILKYRQELVLDIINNEIGDIVQTGGSGLDYWPLAQKDVFMDLDERLKALPYYDDLNHEVLEANRISGKICALPTFYNFFQYELNENLADKAGIKPTGDVKWSDVLTWIPKLQAADPSATLFNHGRSNEMELEEMLIRMLVANMPDLIDIEEKTVNLNQKWFKDLMIQYKGISKSNNIGSNTQPFDSSNRTQNSLLSVWSPDNMIYYDLSWYIEGLKKKPIKMIPSFVGEKNNNRIAYSRYMYSINQRTEKPEKAWQFLSFLITEEIQNTKEIEGAPLNIKSLDNRLLNMDRSINLEDSTIQSNWVKPYYENIEKIDFLNDMAYMKEDLLNEIKRFVNDEITLDEALKTAEQKIMIRLNE